MIHDRDRFAIARYDRDGLILSGDWLVSANNLNLAFLNLSIFSDFLICGFHFGTDKIHFSVGDFTHAQN